MYYVKFFVSAMALALLIAIVAFVITARRKEAASPEEVPYKKLGKTIILASIAFVLIVTPLSIDLAGARNPLPHEVTYNGVTAAEGFRVAIDYNCMGCHTIVGNGAYYAPDLGYIARRAWDPETIRGLLEAYTGTKFMPFKLTERELDALTAWMLYLRDLNTNRWPPMPPKEVIITGTTLETSGEARSLYERYCSACHGVDGSGVVPGTPDFRDPGWWKARIAEVGWEGLVDVVLKGKGAMPGFAATLTTEQARAILEYAYAFSQQKPAEAKKMIIGGYSFEPSFEENLGNWYESYTAWIVYWLFTVAMASILIYLFFYWYARG